MHPAYEDDALRALSSADRTALSGRLLALQTELDAGLTGGGEARELFITITACASLVLVPWIAVLPAVLPASHAVSNWRAVWVGFDVALAILLAWTAWLAFRRRQTVVLVAFISATWLVCDAWFDVMTAAHGWDHVLSLATAAVELGLAAILFNTARLFLHFAAHTGSSPDASRLTDVFGGSRGALGGLPADLTALSLRRAIRRHRSARANV